MERVTKALSEVRETVHAFSTSTDEYLGNNELVLEDSIPVPLQVQAATDEIQKIKFELVAIRAKELFLEKVTCSGDEDLTDDFVSMFPSTTETADLEIELAQEKSALREIKTERREAEEKLSEVAASYEVAQASLTKAKKDIEEMVQTVHFAQQKKRIQQVLATDHLDGLEKLMEENPELYKDAAALLMNRLTLDIEMREEREAVQKSERAALAAVTAMEEEIAEQKAELENVQHDVEEHERANADSQSLRQKVLQNDADLNLAQALTGIELESVGKKQVVVQVRPQAFDVARGTALGIDKDVFHSVKIGLQNDINSRATRAVVTNGDNNECVETDLRSAGLSSSAPIALSTELTCLVSAGAR